MKKIVLVTMCIILSLNLSAQKSDAELTKVEKFLDKRGALIQKELTSFHMIFGISDMLEVVRVKVIYLESLADKSTQTGILFEYDYKSKTAVSYLDDDEVDNLIKYIKLAQDKVTTMPVESIKDNTEFTFTSKSGFQFGYFYKKEWMPFLKINTIFYFLKKEDVSALVTSLEETGKKTIQSYKK